MDLQIKTEERKGVKKHDSTEYLQKRKKKENMIVASN